MKCPNCGAEIGNNQICEFCGSQITLAMKKAQEQLNKKGCPICGSSNISFNRENHGEIQGKNQKHVVVRTVGICRDCGHTWYPSGYASTVPKKNNTIWWVLGWLFFFPAPVMVLIWRKKNTWDVKIKAAVTAAFFLLLLLFNSFSDNTTPASQNDLQTSVKSVTESHLYDNAEVIDLISGTGNNKIGTITVSHANQADCTEKALSDWYANHVKTHEDSNFHIIVYDDIPNKGVYSNGLGFIQKDISLIKEANGSYTTGDDAGSTYYTVNEDYSLSARLTMVDESVLEPIKKQIDAIIPSNYKDGNLYSVDVAGTENNLDCNITLVSKDFANADLTKIAVDLGTQIKEFDLGIKYFNIAFQIDDSTLLAVSSIDDLSSQDVTEISTKEFNN